jgi:hypothetical protein
MHITTAKSALLEDTEQDLLRVKTTTTRQKNSLPQRGKKNLSTKNAHSYYKKNKIRELPNCTLLPPKNKQKKQHQQQQQHFFEDANILKILKD